MIIGLLLGSYLLGALPFGYWVGRWRGVNLFTVGSGNIGATNAGRVLGWPYGLLVFVLDCAKGAIPPLVVVSLYQAGLNQAVEPLMASLLQVGAAASAFLGHLYPVYLNFRGGKGIATGAGTVLVLAPLAAAGALCVWGMTVLVSRYVSVASLLAAVTLLTIHLSLAPEPWSSSQWPLNLYLLFGVILVFVKHRKNLLRLWQGQENRLGDWPMRHVLLRVFHLVAVGMWFGGAFFFNFLAAPAIFRSFEEVVRSAPSDRTAYMPLVPPEAPEEQKKALASALAGSAVGPIFPLYFALQMGCAALALLTALSWWNGGGIHRWRVIVIGIAAAGVLIGWPLSEYVSELRLARFSDDPLTAQAAQSAFGVWHGYSLFLSLITTVLAGVCLILAAWLPYETSKSKFDVFDSMKNQ
ncbi:MAG: glycerol-3-phosphate 1-O-acyltransferase PlsY [Gemmataceae bacterium]|nr:glycerol-3-phosphate 1-O-acyltransferase PlsY [Gemmataceae bacterium]